MKFIYRLKKLPLAACSLLWVMLPGILLAQAPVERINLDRREMSTGRLLQTIEAQTDLTFAYSFSTIDTASVVKLSENIVTLRDALESLVAGKDFTYVLQGNYIAFVPTGAVNRPQVHQQRTNDTYERSDSDGSAAPVVRPPKEPGEAEAAPIRVTAPPVVYPAPYSDYRPVDRYAALQTTLPRFAVKTNLLYAGIALAPNVAFEFPVTPRQTIEVSGSYNGWYRDENKPDNTKQLVHTVLRGEYRWWMCERYNGHFFGAHAFYTGYRISAKNVPLLFDKENRYEGYGIGVGGTYGYNLPLSKEWGLEFNIGLGVGYFKYDQYTCAACDRQGESRNKWYIGPTRAGITLVYQLK